ncbi:metallophosphoesterase [Pigmentibacter ruber]|uniref:metallophosphoesterase n=1 Tax=Pigmentibacter ruber TaxID=2683196 RepID=UPI00131BCF17|nr:metallophosphoesterase [Pigmentibacter ruber]
MDFFRILIVILFLIFSYFYLCRSIHIIFGLKRKSFIYITLALFMFLTNLGFWGSRYFRGQGSIPYQFEYIYWVSFILLGFMFFMLSCFFIADIFSIIIYFIHKIISFKKTKKSENLNKERRRILHFISLGIAACFTGVAYVNARRIPQVKEVFVPIKNLHDELKDFSIVQLTDLHIGQTIGKEYVEAVVEKVNLLNADIVVITGDLIDGFVEQIQDWVKPLSNLKAKYGIYYVTGNHEYYWDAEGWVKYIQSLGIHYLGNSNHLLNIGKSKVIICGVNDLSAEKFIESHKMDLEKSKNNAPQFPHLKILLAHQPNTAFEAVKLNYFDLQISGHTHGGQIWPMTWLIHFIQYFRPGLTAFQNMYVYVSRGTGYWGPPARLGSDSEITFLKIKQV